MSENSFETQYDLTKKSKIKEFYESNKILIYLSVFFLIFIFVGYAYYQDSKEKKKILISEKYSQAKVYLENENKTKASELLRNIILSNDSTYSTLSFFMMLERNLINNKEISKLFEHLLENNKFDEEIKNLLLYKKALHKSSYVEESELIKEIRPLLNDTKSVWRAHALMLLGDFYFSKKEYIKAKDFYIQILSTKEIQKDIYDHAKLKIFLITDE